MTDRWIGCYVSVHRRDCGKPCLGYVCSVDTQKQLISIVSAERTSSQCRVKEITTLNAKDILDIKILDVPVSKSSPSILGLIQKHQTLAPPQEYSTSSHVHIQQPEAHSASLESPVKNEDSCRKRDPWKKMVTTPKRGDSVRRRLSERDKACFDAPIDNSILETEFDFEKNLALFNKQSVFEEIDALTKPDVILVGESQPRYKCDENVLESHPTVLRQIIIPGVPEVEYVTDAGLVVPCVTRELRDKIFLAAEKHGLTSERMFEMMCRATSEMVLQLLGGSYRLNPQNSHQHPQIVIICGPHLQGALGANCGRHLGNHGVNVSLLSAPNSAHYSQHFARELSLFNLCGGKQISSVSDLPSTVDMIISTLDGHSKDNFVDPYWYGTTLQWAKQCKAPILCLDPPPKNITLEPKWILVPVLPFAYSDKAISLYLCDVGIPKEIFKTVGIQYSSPFGSKFVIPLYSKAV